MLMHAASGSIREEQPTGILQTWAEVVVRLLRITQ